MLIDTLAHGQAVNLTSLPIRPNKESDKDSLAVGDPKKTWIFIDKTRDGKPLTIGDKSYRTGLEQLHGSLSWSYALDGQYGSLTTDLGQHEGSPTVQVLGDGKVLYDSGTLPQKGHVTAIVDVRGVKELQFTVFDNIAGIPWNDHVIIGNPILYKRVLGDATDTKGPGGTPAPQAKIVASATDGVAPLDVNFTGDQSKAPAGQVGRYTWYFGDGQTETLAPNPRHTYTDPGVYEVVMQAEDDKGGTSVARQMITVRPGENEPPVAILKASARVVKSGQTVQFDASDSSSPDGAITDYQWDFGDGQQGNGKTVSHSYTAAQRYTTVLTVLNKGRVPARASASIKVTGGNEPPVFPLHRGARVLLVGNSLIGFSGPIDGWLLAFDKMSPTPLGLVCESRGKGLGKLVEYATWSRLAIHDKINMGWDVVIIQPWIDAVDPKVSDDDLLASCKTLVDWARDAGAYPVLYEPQFGWQNLDKDQAYGHQRISHMAKVLDTGLIPAGQAWLQVAKDFPMKLPGQGRSTKESDPDTLDGLMYGDFGHQNFNGALFNAMMIWKYLTGTTPSTLPLAATTPAVPSEAKKHVLWDRLPYLEKTADAAIVPASQHVR
jgi:PKD repeat protein